MSKSIALTFPRTLLPKSLLAGLALAAGLAMSHPAKAMVSISVRFAPPPLMIYEQPMIPAPGYIWVPGYWAWADDIGDYYWVPGQWVLPPFAGALWTPGYWAWNDGVYFFHRGYWGPVVGYYGGINYGFGYFGSDYVGGYWHRGVFNYNRGYNRIDNRVVNVYNNTTIINKTVINNNRISYNGGPGGVNAQPTMQQRQAERQRHWDAVPDQRAAMQQSREDRTARFNYNHGQADRMQWRGTQSPTPPATPAPQQPAATVQPPHPRNMPSRPARGNMMPTDGIPDRRPQQWPGARERTLTPEDRAAMREERRPIARPPMPAPAMQPRMQQPRPMVMHAPQPIVHPTPQQQQQQPVHGGGNPHRDERRRDNNGGD
ncbi:YXWGXW repeat-containing protein [Solilutibacter silvestris]|uniref:YXWGXW repeat-containing protein n=1 Tax=Solilutibacter silvestris TaxID=1645665 RepID=UPI003D32ABCB